MDVTGLFVTGVVTVVAFIVFGIVVAVVMSENPTGRINADK